MMNEECGIYPEVLRQMEAHARAFPDQEVCGFVYASMYVPLTNRAVDRHIEFYADPAEVAQALARHGEPTAIFHIHPPHAPLLPSAKDRDEYYYNNSTIIIGKLIGGRLHLLESAKRGA